MLSVVRVVMAEVVGVIGSVAGALRIAEHPVLSGRGWLRHCTPGGDHSSG